MKIVVQSPSQISLIGPEDIKDWREKHAVFIDGAEYTQKYKKGYWDGKKRPGQLSYVGKGTWSLKLGRGMLEYILEDFPDIDVEYEYDPEPYSINIEDYEDNFDIEPLRDYQYEALELLFEEKWGRVALATNAGKGAIIGIAAGIAADHGIQSVILTDEIAVFQALQTEIEKWGGYTPELVESGRDDPPVDAPIVLAMVPTLTRRIGKEDTPKKRHDMWKEWVGWLNGVGMCLLDEADRSTAPTWQQILRKMPNNIYRAGFSGSFDTQKDEREMVQKETMGPILTMIKNKELIKRGISAKPLVELVKYTQNFEPPPAETWFGMHGPERRQWAYEIGVMYNEDRHNLILDLLEPNAQNAIVVNRIDHGHSLRNHIRDSVFLSGSDSKEVRAEVLEQFRRGEFQHLITTKILDRGTNLLGHAIGLLFVSGEGSTTQTLQRIGRGLRKGGDKEYLYLKDIIDVPPPWAINNSSLRVDPYKYFVTASRKRIKLYHKEGFEVDIVDTGT